MCRGQDPPMSSGLLSSRQMFSVNNYYVVTYMSSKKQVQTWGLILSTQHSSVSTFNTYAGKQVHKAINSCVPVLYILVTTHTSKRNIHMSIHLLLNFWLPWR